MRKHHDIWKGSVIEYYPVPRPKKPHYKRYITGGVDVRKSAPPEKANKQSSVTKEMERLRDCYLENNGNEALTKLHFKLEKLCAGTIVKQAKLGFGRVQGFSGDNMFVAFPDKGCTFRTYKMPDCFFRGTVSFPSYKQYCSNVERIDNTLGQLPKGYASKWANGWKLAYAKGNSKSNQFTERHGQDALKVLKRSIKKIEPGYILVSSKFGSGKVKAVNKGRIDVYYPSKNGIVTHRIPDCFLNETIRFATSAQRNEYRKSAESAFLANGTQPLTRLTDDTSDNASEASTEKKRTGGASQAKRQANNPSKSPRLRIVEGKIVCPHCGYEAKPGSGITRCPNCTGKR